MAVTCKLTKERVSPGKYTPFVWCACVLMMPVTAALGSTS